MYDFIKKFDELENLEGYEFVKSITRNYNQFKIELETLEKAKNANKGFIEYQEAVQTLIKDNSQVDEAGNPVISKDEQGRETYTLIEKNIPSVNKKIATLEKKYKDVIDTQRENDEKFVEELNSDIGESLFVINESDVPKNIKAKQMKLIFPMIKF